MINIWKVAQPRPYFRKIKDKPNNQIKRIKSNKIKNKSKTYYCLTKLGKIIKWNLLWMKMLWNGHTMLEKILTVDPKKIHLMWSQKRNLSAEMDSHWSAEDPNFMNNEGLVAAGW